MSERNTVDEAGRESFPASDAPAWTLAGLGSPGPDEATERLIAALNEDLARELGAVLRYMYQSGKAFGPVGEHAREMLREAMFDELRHAAFLAEVIVDLGGEPTTAPAEFGRPDGLKEMLELDLMMESRDVARCTEHARLADDLGHLELKRRLEEIAAEEAAHARALRRVLSGM